MAKVKTAITPTREEDYATWYQQIVKVADLAEHSPVRGCMVIKPFGYALWENIQGILNAQIKATGHKNAYFPLLIPLSFFEKEASHVEGFAKECAIVTHYRLEKKDNQLVPAKDSKLQEPLIIRPTSEMIIGEMFSKWIESYRDLPLLINQWANIVRWEMRTRFFLRTAEFLWQEGHTAHANEKEAEKEVFTMLNLYEKFLKEYLSIPTIVGKKTQKEKFPGANETYCLEALMQDRKALQACTSHDLGQNFSKASNIKFTNEKGNIEYAWTTSWGITTRIIGALIMIHSDDNGLIIPPRIAPFEVVILPVIHSLDVKEKIIKKAHMLKTELEKLEYHLKTLNVEIDTSDLRGGEKKWAWVKKGIPLIVEIGPKEIEKDSVFIMKRNTLETFDLKMKDFILNITKLLDDMQDQLFEKAKSFQEKHTHEIEDLEGFYKFFTPKNKKKPEIHGGFAKCYFCLDEKEDEKANQDLAVSVRCILEKAKAEKPCIFCKKNTKNRVVFAKAY